MRRSFLSMSYAKDPSCLFCKIIAGQIPCLKLAEDSGALAFMDINPLSAGHCLVIPKHHCQKLHELPPECMASVGPMMVRVCAALAPDNYNVLQNNGAMAHQSVFHVHFHIIPKLKTNVGLGVTWRPLVIPRGEIEAAADAIRAKM